LKSNEVSPKVSFVEPKIHFIRYKNGRDAPQTHKTMPRAIHFSTIILDFAPNLPHDCLSTDKPRKTTTNRRENAIISLHKTTSVSLIVTTIGTEQCLPFTTTHHLALQNVKTVDTQLVVASLMNRINELLKY